MNASPFQAGSLMIYYMPNFDATNYQYQQHTRKLTSKSQLPGLRMHTCHNECILRIPYVAPVCFYDLANTTMAYPWARVNIDVLTPLRVGASGSQNVEVSTFLSFEDVELEGPIFPQSGIGTKAKKVPRATIKSRKKPAVNITEEEQKSMPGMGPLEQTFSGLSGLATKAEGVPILSAIAKPAGWFFNIGKSVAAYFGWSKPLDETTLVRVGQAYHHFMYNSDGKDMSQPLSMMAENKVQVLDNVPGHNLDEMSFNFIKSQWAYYGTYQVTTSSDDNLTYIDLCPYVMATSDTLTNDAGNVSCISHTPVSFLQNFFEYYRGSLRLKFRIIKTDFHAGSLAIAYLPYYPGVAHTTLTVDKLARLHAEVIDIQNVDEITLEFPYADPAPYKLAEEPYGRVYLYWVNQLKCPDSVSTTIDIVVEVAGAPDLEFAVPRNIIPQPIYQQDGLGVEECESVETAVGNAGSAPNSAYIANVCIGEKINSVLQFLKAYHRIILPFNGPQTGPTQPTTANGKFNPNVVGGQTCVAAATGGTGPFVSGIYGDPFNAFAVCYVYRRGSVRVRMTCPPTAATYNISLTPNNTSAHIVGAATAFMSEGITNVVYLSKYLYKMFVQYVGSTGGWSVQVPFYSRYPLALNIPVWDNPVAATTNYPPESTPRFFLEYKTNDVAAPTDIGMFHRAVGEDFQFCYWIGVPTMTTA